MKSTKTLKDLKLNKSPGNDGLTVEFYRYLWNIIKNSLIASINYSLETGKLSGEQRKGIITLVPKKTEKRILEKLETHNPNKCRL